MMVIEIALCLLSMPFFLAATYLFVLTLLSGRLPELIDANPRLRFAFVVPAHNEALGIVRTIHNLLAVDWPSELRRVIVVADNCTDDTAAVAAAAGAEVLVRNDPNLRGKGYALHHAFHHVTHESWADAVVVIDADTFASANLLRAFSPLLEHGEGAAQGFYAVSNPHESWRAGLNAIAFTLVQGLRRRGRERLGGTGLVGNGMCFATSTIRKVPYKAYSVVEDLEYSIHLGRAGIRAAYADHARVYSEMVSNEGTARVQRQRWESGRSAVAQQHALPLLRDAVRNADPLLLDLAVDLLVPPLAKVVVPSVAMGLVGTTGILTGWLSWPTAIFLMVPTLFLVGYVLRGIVMSGLGWRGFGVLAHVPGYLLWKLSLRRTPSRASEWVRTTRETPPK